MLILACKRLKSLKDQVIASPESIHTLDLTGNTLKDGPELAKFPNLVNLILDNNVYFFIDDFPTLSKLETFSANKNQFNNLGPFLEQLKKKCPKLKNLSLVGNPLCPYFEGGKAYESYKAKVLGVFPDLDTLDGGYVEKKGVKLNVESKKHRKAAPKDVEKDEESKMQESVQTFKKEAVGYKIKDLDQEEGEEENEDEVPDQANEKRLLSVIEYNEKYMNKPMRNMKLRSEGNRFVKNDQL